MLHFKSLNKVTILEFWFPTFFLEFCRTRGSFAVIFLKKMPAAM